MKDKIKKALFWLVVVLVGLIVYFNIGEVCRIAAISAARHENPGVWKAPVNVPIWMMDAFEGPDGTFCDNDEKEPSGLKIVRWLWPLYALCLSIIWALDWIATGGLVHQFGLVGLYVLVGISAVILLYMRFWPRKYKSTN